MKLAGWDLLWWCLRETYSWRGFSGCSDEVDILTGGDSRYDSVGAGQM